jgi:hypothetical protein
LEKKRTNQNSYVASLLSTEYLQNCTVNMEQLTSMEQERADGEMAGGVSNLILPQGFIEDPALFLSSIASQQPSRQGLASLSGPVAKWFVSAAPRTLIGSGGQQGPATHHPASQVACLYLQAAAVQLRDDSRIAGDVEQEMVKAKNQYEILEAVGAAAALCPNRMSIASSGIILTLGQLMLHSQSVAAADPAPTAAGTTTTKNASSSSRPTLASSESNVSIYSCSSSFPQLQQVSVEFLQCSILAEQYRYAARFIKGTWPFPTNTVNIKTVLRYFYLRGLVHAGCGDHAMAHRCWWTCLSVPAEICSAIMVAAWKKLSLVQPLLERSLGAGSYSDRKAVTTRFPVAMPKCMARLLTSGKESKDEAVLLYTQLGPAVEMGSEGVVQSLISHNETLLKSDGNYGLALACLKQVRRIQVWHASQLFSVVPVVQLAQRWNVPPEQVRQRLIESTIPCRLEDDGMVVFDMGTVTSTADSSTSNCFSGLHSGLPQSVNEASSASSWIELSEWMQLLERMQRLDAIISTNPKYLALLRKEEKGGGGAGEATAMAGPRGVEDF